MRKYIEKNIKLFIKREPGVFAVIQLCALLSGLLLCVCWGAYMNYRASMTTLLANLYTIKIDILQAVTKEELSECLEELPEYIWNRVKGISVSSSIENGLYVECNFTMNDGKIEASGFGDNMLRNRMTDLWFDEDQEQDGDKVALVCEYRTSGENLTRNTEIEIQGKCYRVIGTHRWSPDAILAPWNSLDEDFQIKEKPVSFSFLSAYTEKEYDKITEIFTQRLGERISVHPMTGMGFQSITIRTAYGIIALTAVVMAADMALLYLYLLEKRKRQTGVFLLCGLDRSRVASIYMGECIVCSIPAFCIGTGLFHLLIRWRMYQIYPYIEGIYSGEIYLGMLGVYFVISSLVMGTMITGKLLRIPLRGYLRG